MCAWAWVCIYERKKVSCYLFGKWYVLDSVMPKLNVRYDYTRTDLLSHLAKEIIRGITHYRLRRRHCSVNRLTWLWQIVFHVFFTWYFKYVIKLYKKLAIFLFYHEFITLGKKISLPTIRCSNFNIKMLIKLQSSFFVEE